VQKNSPISLNPIKTLPHKGHEQSKNSIDAKFPTAMLSQNYGGSPSLDSVVFNFSMKHRNAMFSSRVKW